MERSLSQVHMELSKQVDSLQRTHDQLAHAITAATTPIDPPQQADRVARAIDAAKLGLEQDVERIDEAIVRFRNAVQAAAAAMVAVPERAGSTVEAELRRLPEAADEIVQGLSQAGATLVQAFENAGADFEERLESVRERYEGMLETERSRLQNRMDRMGDDVAGVSERVTQMVSRLETAFADVLFACRSAGFGLNSAASGLNSATRSFGQVG